MPRPRETLLAIVGEGADGIIGVCGLAGMADSGCEYAGVGIARCGVDCVTGVVIFGGVGV
ncbi:MAG TPA: hypothetical protein VLF43_01610 [Candidatus Saccharimonadales bacterium]|nr:hypothetical protein [Candidatus Saccharimonadales bacterium]